MGTSQVDLPLNQEIEDFLNYCLDTSKSLVTVNSYGQALRAFALWLADNHPDVETITSISVSHLQQFRRYLRISTSAQGKEMALSTQAKYLSILRSWLRYAQREAKLPVLNRDEIVLPHPRLNRRAQPSIRHADIERLLDQPDEGKVWGLRDRAIIAVMLSTKLKVSQVCGLDRRDVRVDLLGSTAKLPLRLKSRGRMSVILDERAQRCLRAYLDCRQDSYAPLFIRHKPGKSLEQDDPQHRLTRQMVNRMLEKYSRQALIPQLVSPNMLRLATS